MAAKEYNLDQITRVQFVTLLQKQFGDFDSVHWGSVATASKANVTKLIKSLSSAIARLPKEFLLSERFSHISVSRFSPDEFISVMGTYYSGTNTAKVMSEILAAKAACDLEITDSVIQKSTKPNPIDEFFYNWSSQMMPICISIASLATLKQQLLDREIEAHGFYNLKPEQEKTYIAKEFWNWLDFQPPDTAVADPHKYTKIVFRIGNKIAGSKESSTATIKRWVKEEFPERDFSKLQTVAEEYRQRLKKEGKRPIEIPTIRKEIDKKLAALNPSHIRQKVGKRAK